MLLTIFSWLCEVIIYVFFYGLISGIISQKLNEYRPGNIQNVNQSVNNKGTNFSGRRRSHNINKHQRNGTQIEHFGFLLSICARTHTHTHGRD